MRVVLRLADRTYITHNILSVFRDFGLTPVMLETSPPHLYVFAESTVPICVDQVYAALLSLPGIQDARAVDALPSELKGFHLEALRHAAVDPVLAVDSDGIIVFANEAATNTLCQSERCMCGRSLAEALNDKNLSKSLLSRSFSLASNDIALRYDRFIVESSPIAIEMAETKTTAGVVLTFHPVLDRANEISVGQSPPNFSEILGRSPAIVALKSRMAKLAALSVPLMILGETGTGKELVARACHQASLRNDAAFLALNCAALPEELAESELFGYVPGAFSGANRTGKSGLLEQANHGSVFLDEIGEMSPNLQAKMLRFLNDGTFRRVGAEHEMYVEVRIICATHRNLEEMVAKGQFREDLFYRLNVLNIHVPPLRERGDDVIALAEYFLADVSDLLQQPCCRLTHEACAALRSYSWPGNIRELRNMMYRTAAIADTVTITPRDLDMERIESVKQMGATRHIEDCDSLDQAIATFEKSLLESLYAHFPSSRLLAARLRTSHTTVANKLRKYGIGHDTHQTVGGA